MSTAADVLRADRDVLLGICAGLTEADWKAESGCPGWSVQDVVSHMTALYWASVDRSHLPDAGDRGIEAAADFHVQQRRQLSVDELLAEYAEISEKAIAVLAGFAGLTAEISLGDLGTYALTTLPTAYCFDHYLHIRADLFAPRGPLGDAVPPASEPQLELTFDWVEAALPQQNAALLAQVDGAIELAVQGAAARTITSGPGQVRARAAGPAPQLARCISGRASWDDPSITLDGDPAALSAVRQLRVF